MASSEREKEWLQQDQGFVTVTLDTGVFHWLYEMVEAKHNERRYAAWIPWYQTLVDRAYEQFTSAIREANAPSNGEAVVPADQPRTRVIHRRVAKKKSPR